MNKQTLLQMLDSIVLATKLFVFGKKTKTHMHPVDAHFGMQSRKLP